jgi:hypothetical protein
MGGEEMTQPIRKSLALIDNEYSQLETDLLNPEITDKDAVLRIIDSNTGNWLTTLDNTTRVVKGLDIEEGFVRKHARYLYDNAKIMNGRSIIIRQGILESMLARGETTLKFGNSGISLHVRDLDDEIIIEDESKVPDSLCKVIPARLEPDTARIKEHINKTGEIPNGVKIIRGRKTLVIK